MSIRTSHVIGNVSWTWDECDSCARSEENGGSCNGDVGTHEYHDLMLCDEFEEMEGLC